MSAESDPDPPLTTNQPLDVFVYHLQRGDPKGLTDGREWGAFRLFGWTAKYERVCILVRDTPTVAYLELRPKNPWTRTGGWKDWIPDIRTGLQNMMPELLSETFQTEIMSKWCKYSSFKWKSVELIEKVMNNPGRYERYVPHTEQGISIPSTPTTPIKLVPIKTPLLRLEFENSFSMRDFEQHLRMDHRMKYDDNLNMYLHETDSWIDLPIRCFARHNMSQSGWMRIKEYVRYHPDYREEYESHFENRNHDRPSGKASQLKRTKKWSPVVLKHHWCRNDVVDYDLVVSWNAFEPVPHDPPPLLPKSLMVFDIETYSSRSIHKKAYPEFTIPEDCVFQISIVMWSGERPHDPPEVVLLSLKEPDRDIVGKDCTTIWCRDEFELISVFIPYVDRCDVFTGWNILNYDWEYIYRRAQFHGLEDALLGVGWLENHQGKWEQASSDSKAQATQNFKYIDVMGKLQVDMLPIVRRNYTGLRNYKLNTVLRKFKMPVSKDDLNAMEMFRLFRRGTTEDMGRIGHYCKVDSIVCLDLWKRLNIWVGLLEMSKLTGVGLLPLYTRGTQIQTATRVVRVLWSEDKVLGCLNDFDPSNPSGRRKQVEQENGVSVSHSMRKEKKYAGATVLTAIPGLYRWVVVLDFAGLYPSIMRGRNLDHGTLVRDDLHPNKYDDTIPDELCNVISWSDHLGCEHDTQRKRLKNGEFSKAKGMVICAENKFRWLKEEVVGEGLLPKLLTGFINARKQTRKRMDVVRNTQLKPCVASVLVRLVNVQNGSPTSVQLSQVQKEHSIFDEIVHTGEKDTTLDVVRSEWSEVVKLSEQHSERSLEELVEMIRAVLIEIVVLDKRQLAYKICANCFPEDHEILTDRGFMNLAQVTQHFRSNDTLMVGVRVNEQLKFHPVSVDKLIVDDGEHDMIEFDDGKGMSVQCTENHRMWVSAGSRDAPMKVMTADEVARSKEPVWFDCSFTDGIAEKTLVERIRRFKIRGKVWCLTVPIEPPVIVVRKSGGHHPVCTLNSTYGATGASDGMIPMQQIAACTTAQGRMWIKEVSEWTTKHYKTRCVYGDTDSVFLIFDNLISNDKDATIRALSETIEPMLEKINSTLFPPQVKLEFEKIFENLILLSKKRYLGNLCDRFGVFLQKLIRGCALVRRDFGPLIQDLYALISDRMLNECNIEPRERWVQWNESLKQDIGLYILSLFQRQRKLNDFVLSCGISRPRAGYKADRAPKHILLWDRVEARQDQCVNNQRVKSDSNVFTPGMRIEFVAIETPVLPVQQQFQIQKDSYEAFIHTTKKLQVFNLEELEYYQQWTHLVKLNLLWYVSQQMHNPMNELMKAVFGEEAWFQPLVPVMDEQIEIHERRRSICESIKRGSRQWLVEKNVVETSVDGTEKVIPTRLVFIHPASASVLMLHSFSSTQRWYLPRLKRLVGGWEERRSNVWTVRTIEMVNNKRRVVDQMNVLWRPYLELEDAYTYILPIRT